MAMDQLPVEVCTSFISLFLIGGTDGPYLRSCCNVLALLARREDLAAPGSPGSPQLRFDLPQMGRGGQLTFDVGGHLSRILGF